MNITDILGLFLKDTVRILYNIIIYRPYKVTKYTLDTSYKLSPNKIF